MSGFDYNGPREHSDMAEEYMNVKGKHREKWKQYKITPYWMPKERQKISTN